MTATLPQILEALWGRKAPGVAEQYREVRERLKGCGLFWQDLAMFCNAAAHIEGDNEFERGVAEGKRRVFLHLARVAELTADDFVPIADGARLYDGN